MVYNTSDFCFEFFNDAALIFKRSDHRFIELNSSGAVILKGLLDHQPDNEIAVNLKHTYQLDRSRAHLDIQKFKVSLQSIGIDVCSPAEYLTPIVSAPETTSLLSFHASTVILDNQAVLFAGEGGAGKSTLAGLFEENGFESPGDEVADLFLCEANIWRLLSSLKKINGKYCIVDSVNCPRISTVVFLRNHLDHGYRIESCRPTLAVQKGFSCLFCNVSNQEKWYGDAFHYLSKLFQQSGAIMLDFSKSLDFLPAIKNLVNGGVIK